MQRPAQFTTPEGPSPLKIGDRVMTGTKRKGVVVDTKDLRKPRIRFESGIAMGVLLERVYRINGRLVQDGIPDSLERYLTSIKSHGDRFGRRPDGSLSALPLGVREIFKCVKEMEDSGVDLEDVAIFLDADQLAGAHNLIFMAAPEAALSPVSQHESEAVRYLASVGLATPKMAEWYRALMNGERFRIDDTIQEVSARHAQFKTAEWYRALTNGERFRIDNTIQEIRARNAQLWLAPCSHLTKSLEEGCEICNAQIKETRFACRMASRWMQRMMTAGQLRREDDNLMHQSNTIWVNQVLPFIAIYQLQHRNGCLWQ